MPTPQIDPRVLQALAAGQDINQFGYMASPYQNMGEWTGGESGGYMNPGQKQTLLYQDIGNNTANVFDERGNYIGPSSGDSDSRMLGKFIASALAMYAGGQMMGGSPTGAEMGGGAAAGGGGAGAGLGGGVQLTAADIAATNAAASAGLAGNVAALAPVELGAMGAAAGGGIGAAAGAGGGAGGGTPYLSAAADSQAANAALGLGANAGSVPASVNLANAGGTMATGANSFMGLDYGTWAKLAGGLLGAYEGKDQEQTSTQTKEPWGPAQGLLKELIGQTQATSQQYQQQPFSAAQQQAYGNVAGLLNGINGGVPGLLQGMSANASGANNYDRNNPRRQLTGSNFNMAGFSPGLLSFFQQGGK